MGKKIVFFEDGIAKKRFDSLEEASLATGIEKSRITMCLKELWDGYKNFDFKYEVSAVEARENYWKNKKKK